MLNLYEEKGVVTMLGISVIVPVYNVEKLLERCLNSLVNQTFNNFEIIIINDGSTDSSFEIVKKFQKSYSHLITVVDQANQGIGNTRNNGIALSKGKYLYFIDSDDYISANTLEKMYQLAEVNKADYVIGGFDTVTEEETYLASYPVEYSLKEELLFTQDHKDLFLAHNAVWNRLFLSEIVKTEAIRFLPGLMYEDLLFSRQYFLRSQRAVIMEDNPLQYVQRDGSLMASMKTNNNLDFVEIFTALINDSKEKNLYTDYKDYIEFLAIKEVFIAAIVRVSRGKQYELADKIHSEFLTLFPNYKKNQFIRRLSFKHKLLLKLSSMKMFKVITILFK